MSLWDELLRSCASIAPTILTNGSLAKALIPRRRFLTWFRAAGTLSQGRLGFTGYVFTLDRKSLGHVH